MNEYTKLYLTCNKDYHQRILEKAYRGIVDNIEKHLKSCFDLFEVEEYRENDKLKGFIIYTIDQKVAILIETQFRTENKWAFLGCLKKITKGCSEVLFCCNPDNSHILNFYDRIGAQFLDKRGAKCFYSLQLRGT